MTPEQITEHKARMQRISDKCLKATGNRPDVLAADYKTAVALEAALDKMLAMQTEEARP